MARKDTQIAGLCLPLTDLYDNLEEVGVAATDSSYTEAGPSPGHTVPDDNKSKALPIISGVQTSDMEIVTIDGGNASLVSNPLSLGWRFSGEANSKVRGWNPPNVFSGYSWVKWASIKYFDKFSICTHTPTQKLCIIYSETGGDKYFKSYDPATDVWSTESSIVNSFQSDSDAITCFPDGRLMAVIRNRSYRSDDLGVTWTLNSRSVFPDTTTLGIAWTSLSYSSLANNGTQAVMIAQEVSTSKLYQLVSSDGLNTFQLVDTESAVGTRPSVISVGSYFVVAYLTNTDAYPAVKILGSANSLFSSADEVILKSSACLAITAAVDSDGVIFIQYTLDTGSVYCQSSVDLGTTWVEHAHASYNTEVLSTDFPILNMKSTMSCGAMYIAHNFIGSSSFPFASPLVVSKFGGWSNVTAGQSDWGTASTNPKEFTNRLGPTTVYTPFELPENGTWTASGAGTGSLSVTGPLNISTTANQKSYSDVLTIPSFKGVFMGELKVTTNTSLAADNIVAARRGGNGTNEYAVKLRFSTTAIRAVDEISGSTLATTGTLDLTTPMQFLINLDGQGTSEVFYKRPYESVWISFWSGSLTMGSGALSTRRMFGHDASSTSNSDWYWVADCNTNTFGNTLNSASNPILGRPLSNQPVPLTIETGSSSLGPAYLSAISGPAYLKETYTVPVSYQYPIESIFPDQSPSPNKKWRSTSTSEQLIAFDFGRNVWKGDAFAVPFINVNFQLAYLEAYIGGVWSTIGDYNGAIQLSGLTADLDGDCITPSAATITAGRFLQEGELAGSYLVLNGTKARKIVTNTAGLWAGSGVTCQKPRIILDHAYIDGTESATSGCVISAHSGVLVVLPSATSNARRLRIRIPTQTICESYFEAGIIAPFKLMGVNAADFGYSQEIEQNSRTYTSPSGTTRVKTLGKPIRNYTFGWAEGASIQYAIRNATTTTPDYLSAGGGTAIIGTDQDVPGVMNSLITQSDSGRIPMLFLPKVPTATTTITDRTLWIYGRLDGSSRQDHVVGVEGTNEIVRQASVTVRELV